MTMNPNGMRHNIIQTRCLSVHVDEETLAAGSLIWNF